MPKGGYRSGAGRPKGKKDSKPRKQTKVKVEAEDVRKMLDLDTKTKDKLYQEFLIRISKNEKLTIAEKKLMDQLSVELAKELGGETEPGVLEGLQPLEYMLRVMNDPNEDPSVRRQMAQAAAPYCHPRKGEAGAGKKEEAAERAKKAGQGRFAPSRPPGIAVVK